MRHFVLSLVLLGGLAGASSARVDAQEPVVAVGARVRLTLPADRPRRFGVFRPGGALVGDVVRITPETLTVRQHPLLAPMDVPRSTLQHIHISRGPASRWRSALGGAVGGALIGMLWGHVLYEYDLRSGAFDTHAHARSRGAVAGAVGLALEGAIFPRERWRRVR